MRTYDPIGQKRRQTKYEARKRVEDPEGFRAMQTAKTTRWRVKNPERQASAQRSWRERNPGYGAQWRKDNAEQHRRSQRESRHGCKQRYEAPTNCECCNIIMAKTPKGPTFDHCHETSFHRGWLCNSCNNGIARLGDSRDGLLKALAYLDKAEAAWIMQ